MDVKPSGKIIIETYNGTDFPKISIFGEVEPKDIQMLLPAIRRVYFGEYLAAIAKDEVNALEEEIKEKKVGDE